jgi:hypothetical protein
MNAEMILLPVPNRNDLRKMATNHSGWSSKAGQLSVSFAKASSGVSGRGGEIALDFAAERVEIGFEDFGFLGRR